MIKCYYRGFVKFLFTAALTSCWSISSDGGELDQPIPPQNKILNKVAKMTFSDGDVQIDYSMTSAQDFSRIEVTFKRISAFRYTKVGESGGSYYGDPRSGLATTMQFSSAGKLEFIGVSGIKFDFEKIYVWDKDNLTFQKKKVE